MFHRVGADLQFKNQNNNPLTALIDQDLVTLVTNILNNYKNGAIANYNPFEFNGLDYFNTQDRAVSNTVQAYWTNFILSGNPNYNSKVTNSIVVPTIWQPYDASTARTKYYLQFDSAAVLRHNLLPDECDLWDEIQTLFPWSTYRVTAGTPPS